MISKEESVKVTAANLSDYLGVPKFRYGEVEPNDRVGVVTGFAWTDVGGELLTIEAMMVPGKGKMTVTGNVRNVVKESIRYMELSPKRLAFEGTGSPASQRIPGSSRSLCRERSAP